MYIYFLHLQYVTLNALLRWFVGGVTPVPIPNTEVKPSRSDGTPKGEE